MVAEKNAAGLEVDGAHTAPLPDNEKSAALYNDNSDLSSSGVGEYDDLPDPDAGKSAEERAKLVRASSNSDSFLGLLFTDLT
jgi:hypothetical protein